LFVILAVGMNVISIDGVEYVKASIIAKQFNYTADYVGQLCRGRKVDAKLVGRTWYVNHLSLTSHKNARNAKESSAEKVLENNDDVELSRLDVEPVARKSSIKVSGSISSAPANFLKRVEWQPLKYETDEAELNPSLQHLDNPVRVDVDLADSASLKIKSNQDDIQLEAEPMPEVSLRGTLNLSSLDIDFDFPEENIASSNIEVFESKPESKNGTKVFLNKITAPILKKESKKFNQVKEIKESEATYRVEINEGRGDTLGHSVNAEGREDALGHKVNAVSREDGLGHKVNDNVREDGLGHKGSLPFTPARVRDRALVATERQKTVPVQILPLWPTILVFMLGLGILLALYFVEFSVVASAQKFSASWQINTDLVWPF
jgi:hypothetical protein